MYGGVEKCLDVHGRLGCGRCEGKESDYIGGKEMEKT